MRRTKTCVPCPLALSAHWLIFGFCLKCHNGLGAARGQRLRKGPCASYPTRFRSCGRVTVTADRQPYLKTGGNCLASDIGGVARACVESSTCCDPGHPREPKLESSADTCGAPTRRLVVGRFRSPSRSFRPVYELAFQTGTLFHHSNVRLPLALERALNLIVVTPRMHGIHHSDIREQNMSNFGVVFRWWDRLHGTLRLDVPQSAVTIGIPGYSLPDDNRLGHCLAMPFRTQRDYWRRDGEEKLHRDAPAPHHDKQRLS